MGNTEFRLTQFADNTTIILDGTRSSLVAYSKGIISPFDLISANGELMMNESNALNFNVHIDFLSCYRII